MRSGELTLNAHYKIMNINMYKLIPNIIIIKIKLKNNYNLKMYYYTYRHISFGIK